MIIWWVFWSTLLKTEIIRLCQLIIHELPLLLKTKFLDTIQILFTFQWCGLVASSTHDQRHWRLHTKKLRGISIFSRMPRVSIAPPFLALNMSKLFQATFLYFCLMWVIFSIYVLLHVPVYVSVTLYIKFDCTLQPHQFIVHQFVLAANSYLLLGMKCWEFLTIGAKVRIIERKVWNSPARHASSIG